MQGRWLSKLLTKISCLETSADTSSHRCLSLFKLNEISDKKQEAQGAPDDAIGLVRPMKPRQYCRGLKSVVKRAAPFNIAAQPPS
jgi:hypothetical protein